MQEHLSGSISERAAPPTANSKKSSLNGEAEHDHSAKSQGNNSSFSLFHFGGPVALSTGGKLNPAFSNGGAVGEYSSKLSADHVEKDHACNKEAKEYNLFATSNSLRFFNFLK
ncbi:hypothetical protein L6164_034016 [Bauhinia variegata]|nr:hypothetical protein L6164_034016 [Bauhinia variegata]